jgi:hypothetical protein
MKDYYCFDVEFPGIDFNKYYVKFDEVSKVHHAHLFTRTNEIELRIFYNSKTYFGEKLSVWISSMDWRKFGSHIKVSNEAQNDRLLRINLSEAKLCGLSNSTSYFDGNTKYVIIKIDTVKIYWKPVKEEINTAEFYMHDVGFRVVEPFYSILFGFGGNFNISRMKMKETFYKLGKSEFRPEFNTYSSDSRDRRIAEIIKEPKIQFKYNDSVTEAETYFYGKVISSLASFYHHVKIDYSLCRINLPEHTITIKKIEEKNPVDIKGDLGGFNIQWDFHEFLLTDWQSGTLKNFKLISKTIELFNQALLVDDNSEFLIRYNIIEICDRRKQKNERFKSVLKGNVKKNKYKEALNLLLETIAVEEHELFKNKWTTLSGKLEQKPMKSTLDSFLESQNLKLTEFPISTDKLKTLRDCITHGSIDKIDIEELKKTNRFLYRLNGIMILNLMGIRAWKLNTELL